MVKSLTAVLIASLLLFGAVFFEWSYVETQFTEFGEELEALYLKTDAGLASGEDAAAVQTAWETRKERLYVWIPHNDLARIDECMAETVKLIGEGNDSLALAKLGVLLHLTSCLPGTYRPTLENIL